MSDHQAAESDRSVQRLLVGHGALVMLFGCAVGFAFLFFLLGSIRLWPFPGSIDLQLPGTERAWRMTHLEGILNGLALWLLALVMPLVGFGHKAQRRAAWCVIITAWTFVIASLMEALFANSRGLEFAPPWSNTTSFLLFYVGVVLVMGVLTSIAYKAFSGGGRR
jgi:hypothetical protein